MMNLNKRKMLASKVLGVGKNRVEFDKEKISDIKEAITRQDIKDLYAEGIIKIKQIKGRKTKGKRKTKKGFGKKKRTIHKRKGEYVKHVRKQRYYLKELKKQKKIDLKEYYELRKKIKARAFKDKAHLKENIEEIIRTK